MDDLIKRSAVIDVLKETGIIQDNDLGHLVVEEIERIPVAYDVEKVIMNLRCDTNCPNCSPYCADAHICGFDELLKQAIEIIRKGGVE